MVSAREFPPMTRKNAAAITVHPQPSTAHNLRSERGGEATFSISKERSRQIFQPLEAETWASWSKEKDRKGIVGRARGGGQGPSCGRGEGIFAALSAFEPCKCVIRWKETRALVEQARGTRDGRKSRHVPTLKSDPCTDLRTSVRIQRTKTLSNHTFLEAKNEKKKTSD